MTKEEIELIESYLYALKGDLELAYNGHVLTKENLKQLIELITEIQETFGFQTTTENG